MSEINAILYINLEFSSRGGSGGFRGGRGGGGKYSRKRRRKINQVY